jgi:hypothetical protein
MSFIFTKKKTCDRVSKAPTLTMDAAVSRASCHKASEQKHEDRGPEAVLHLMVMMMK